MTRIGRGTRLLRYARNDGTWTFSASCNHETPTTGKRYNGQHAAAAVPRLRVPPLGLVRRWGVQPPPRRARHGPARGVRRGRRAAGRDLARGERADPRPDPNPGSPDQKYQPGHPEVVRRRPATEPGPRSRARPERGTHVPNLGGNRRLRRNAPTA